MVHNPFGSREHGNDQPLANQAKQESPREGEREFRGLCSNCANRQTCLLPKSEGGVWHCEEYLEER